MIIRQAHLGDAEPIAVLHANSWRETYRGMMSDSFLDGDVVSNRRQEWQDRLCRSPSNQVVYVAENTNDLVGFVCAFGFEDATWGSYIDNLHVASGQKRNGIGTILMHQTAVWLARHHPTIGVYLWVFEANTAARRFYERIGASNAESMQKTDPGGGCAANCRYVWPNPKMLANQTIPK